MRDVFGSNAIASDALSTRLRLYGPDSAGTLVAGAGVSETIAPNEHTDCTWIKAGWMLTPWLGTLAYSGWLGAPWLSGAWLSDPARAIAPSITRHEGPLIEFAAQSYDEFANTSAQSATLTAKISTAPPPLRSAAVGVAAGVVTITYTEEVQ